ncbi:flagellar basal body rod protein FlgF [Ramlibacter sp. MAHUQ-53]|uniref:flagellar basal body rod protein FlgF n=1 Tax=unclassified Ramlibacter TaxID=2617605 RepID=UPI003631C693
MDRLVFTSHAAISEKAIERQAIVNEMANVSTVGFKRSFDVAMRSIKVEGSGFDTRFQTQAVARDVIDLTPGALMVTGRHLDIAMNGSTVMGVESADGQLAFTRRGDLRVNAQGTLETGTGQPVRGDGGPIVVPPGFNVSINVDGTVYAADPNQPTAQPALIGQILLRDASERPMARRTDGLLAPMGLPPGSDFASGPQQPTVTTNALEGSNVNAIYAMTRMIDHSRSFEAQVRAIKEAKSLDESGSTLLKPA